MPIPETSGSAFYQYFNEVYGLGRWPKLFESLKAPDKKVARLNPYLKHELIQIEVENLLSERFITEEAARKLSLQSPDKNQFYFLDLASLLPPLSLAPKPGERCLDMCAAPGGKTLVLANLMAPHDGSEFDLIANEISIERRSRLIRVLKEQLPDKIFRQIKITAHDAAKWCLYQKDFYDKILLDAPCSGERYFILDSKEILVWTKKRSQNMGVRQFSLLASAFECLKCEGSVVYSTCSISPFENDEVIRKLLKKRKGRVEILTSKFPIGEATEFGWQILPDFSSGFGPIYFSHIKRIN